ncbi:hypothetical protein CkaCkLH20_02352 [Colletotrichum karsti]|uniref:DUF6351 domain-containing protein n=1 Tax=Colletotrichum karsti TaxID=1095194 RepID=A0A9P6ICL9_9PEZI|nr:uncharacterized protein CkaCkLH20_02352 [Colletotrichum karsti]KAF9880398.1 hypothetical protein CkaCkLH20_02352 [Colletotrichum karsti]
MDASRSLCTIISTLICLASLVCTWSGMSNSTDGIVNRHGLLPDGMEYWIRVPANWNGVLLNDLDAGIYLHYNTSQAAIWTENGYAFSGTSRRADRITKFDPRAERNQQAQVIELFAEEFGCPKTTIQFGCSGGGGVALGVAEAYPDLVDGAISANGGEGLVMANQRLDLLFTLKALIAPNSSLPLVGISYEERESAGQAWIETLDKALNTTAGRARILVAASIAQVPKWGGAAEPYLAKPDPNDEDAVLEAMLRSTTDSAAAAVSVRYLYDSPAGVMSWNTGINYTSLFETADATQRELTARIYKEAGLDLAADLQAIETYPRVPRNETAIAYWTERALTGNPLVPVLQVTTVGDATRSSALLAAYAAGVEKNGKGELYRQAVVDYPGHCTWNTLEMMASLQALLFRLETGSWGNITSPTVMNELGKSFRHNQTEQARFTDPRVLSQKNNREFFP